MINRICVWHRSHSHRRYNADSQFTTHYSNGKSYNILEHLVYPQSDGTFDLRLCVCTHSICTIRVVREFTSIVILTDRKCFVSKLPLLRNENSIDRIHRIKSPVYPVYVASKIIYANSCLDIIGIDMWRSRKIPGGDRRILQIAPSISRRSKSPVIRFNAPFTVIFPD